MRSGPTPTARSRSRPTTSRASRIGAHPHRAAVHPGGLRSTDGDRARADVRDRRRRDGRREVRDQRCAVGHVRRDAAVRRDPRGQGTVVGSRDLDQGGSGRRQDRRRADRPRRVRDRRVRVEHRTCLLVSEDAAHIVARASEGFNKMYGIVHPAEQWATDRNVRLSPFYEREREREAVFYRDRRLGAPELVRVERAAARGVRRSRNPARGRVGLALVVADHQR